MLEEKSSLSPLLSLRNYILDLWRDGRKYFLGRVLTIIDASIADKEQRKGLKDLIEDTYWEDKHHYREEEMRRILLNFVKHFCPDLLPKDKEEEDVFFSRVSSQESPAEPDYFVD